MKLMAVSLALFVSCLAFGQGVLETPKAYTIDKPKLIDWDTGMGFRVTTDCNAIDVGGLGGAPSSFDSPHPAHTPTSVCSPCINHPRTNPQNCMRRCREVVMASCAQKTQMQVSDYAYTLQIKTKLDETYAAMDASCKKHVSDVLLNEGAITRYAEMASRRVAAPVEALQEKVKSLEEKINELELALLGKGKGGNQNIRYQAPVRQNSQRSL